MSPKTIRTLLDEGETYVSRSWIYPVAVVVGRIFRLSCHSFLHPHSSDSCRNFRSLSLHAGCGFQRVTDEHGKAALSMSEFLRVPGG